MNGHPGLFQIRVENDVPFSDRLLSSVAYSYVDVCQMIRFLLHSVIDKSS